MLLFLTRLRGLLSLVSRTIYTNFGTKIVFFLIQKLFDALFFGEFAD